jgi:hypothetical protein
MDTIDRHHNGHFLRGNFATICYFLTERRIRKKCGHRLAYFERYIDDILGVWLVDVSFLVDPEQDPEWLALQDELNTFGHLRWTGSALSKKDVIIDLDITLGNENRFSFITY